MSVLMPVMRCFVLSFEIRKYESSIFVAVSLDCYSYLGSIQSRVTLRMSFTIAAKRPWGFWWRWHWPSAEQHEGGIGRLTVTSPACERAAFPLVCVVSDGFQQRGVVFSTRLALPCLNLLFFLSVILSDASIRIVFLMSFSDCSLLGYRNTTDFFVCWPRILFIRCNVFMRCNSFFM